MLPGLSLPKIPSEPQVEQAGDLLMKLVRRSESGSDLKHKCSAPLSRSKNPDLETSDDAYRRPRNIGEQGMVRVRRRDVRSDDASRRLSGWRQLFRFCVA